MPELPEVETVARQLDVSAAGRRIKRLTITDPKLLPVNTEAVAGARIARVFRSGKQVVLELTGPKKRKPGIWITVHLRMTGRLIHTVEWPSRCCVKQEPRAVLELDDGAICFCDTRRFGTLRLNTDQAEFRPVGIEPLSAGFTAKKLAELAGSSPTPVKTWLLRQDLIVGIGNIYASEICFQAGIHPGMPVGGLSQAQLKRIHQATRRILNAAIRHCGTTFSDFQDSRGQVGGYVKYLRVYNRAGEPCRKCGTPVERIVQAQRSTYYCPACQPEDTL